MLVKFLKMLLKKEIVSKRPQYPSMHYNWMLLLNLKQ